MSKQDKRVRGMGLRLREAFELSGKTAAQVAREIGVSRSSFYRHLDGDPMLPLALARYSLALNVSADWLLGIKRERER